LQQSLAANAQLLAVLRSGRNLDVYSATQRWHRHLCAEYGFPRREVQIEIQIVAFDAVIRVFREANAQEQIARRSATHSCFAAPRQAELLPFAHARRNFYLIVFEFRRLPAAAALRTRPVIDFAAPAATLAGDVAAKRDRTDRALQRFFQRHHDVGFHVLPALGIFPKVIAETGTTSPAAHRTEELLEKIAKTRAAELKVGIHERLRSSARASLAPLPPRWRAKFRPPLPVRAELVVLLSFLRVAQD